MDSWENTKTRNEKQPIGTDGSSSGWKNLWADASLEANKIGVSEKIDKSCFSPSANTLY